MSNRPIPVGTTKRRPLTRLQRSELHKREGGLCCRCGLPVDPAKPFIDEHKTPLALGGSNDMKNRGVCHVDCADEKTRAEDMPRIVKAKAQGASVTSRDPLDHPKLKGRSFPKVPPKSVTRIDKTALPQLSRRALFRDLAPSKRKPTRRASA